MDRSATVAGHSDKPLRCGSGTGQGDSLLANVAPEFAELDLDQFERYAVTARWLAALLSTARTRPIRLLEVGPNVLNLLPEFLDSEAIEVVRCDIFLPDGAEPGFVQIRPNEPLPFEDREFDGVIALEVLEHVPRPERELFLRECLRVTRHACVITCPNGGLPVNTAETLASAAYERRNGCLHPFLEEHARFGQPEVHEVRAVCQPHANGWHDFTISPLNHWLTNLLLQENLVERGVPLELRTLVQQFVLHRSGPVSEADYRRVYIASQSAESTAILQTRRDELSVRPPLLGGDEATPEAILVATALLTEPELQRFLDTLDRTQSDLLAAFQQNVIASSACGDLAPLEGSLGAACDALRELVIRVRVEIAAGRLAGRPDARPFLRRQRARLGSRIRKVRRSAMRGLRRLGRACVATRVTVRDLVPLPGLSTRDPDRNEWTVTSAQTGWYIPRPMAPGPVRVRLELRTSRSGWIRLKSDSHGRFDQGPRFELGETTRRLVIDRYLTLPAHASGLQLELTGLEGTVDIVSLELQQRPRWANTAVALGWKVVTAVRRGTVVNMVRQGVGCLLRGDLTALRAKMATGLQPPPPAPTEVTPSAEVLYERFRRHTRVTDADRARLRGEASRWDESRAVSLILPVSWDRPQADAEDTVRSIQAQISPHWELVIVPTSERSRRAGMSVSVSPALRSMAQEDSRIRLLALEEDESMPAALNRGLAAAERPYVAIIHAGDLLAETALVSIGQTFGANPDLDMVYSDEDCLDDRGGHQTPFFKPDFSFDYLLALPYTQNLAVYRRSTLLKLDGFRPEHSGVHEYDAVLRLATTGGQIGHVAEVLYHRSGPFPFGEAAAPMLRLAKTSGGDSEGQATPHPREQACLVVGEALAKLGRKANVEPDAVTGGQRVQHEITGRPRVSIVIPSACGRATIRGEETWFVLKCVESIVARSTWRNYEIIVVDNNDMPQELAHKLAMYPQVRCVAFTQEFNLATKMTFGADASTGDYVVFMNDDIEALSPGWMEAMLEYAQQPGMGAVGARLLFPDERLQHTGVTILGGNPGHHFYRFPKTHPGYFFNNVVPRDYTAVTGACVMVPATVFRQVGGFSDEFPLNYNDVDLCLKIRAAGLRIVYTPHAELYHHESVTKSGTYEHELLRFKTKWAEALRSDPFYNPNLAMEHNDYSLRRCPAA